MLKILMLSSSRSGDEDYLQSAGTMIKPFLGSLKDVVFVPYAGVSMSWDDYTAKVQSALPQLNIKGIHQYPDAKIALQQAEAILVGGGNTFNLLHQLYHNDLIELIRTCAGKGTPYIGWSAGSNICGNSIRTTNDMPIIQPKSFDALKLVPFQLNPHYSDYQPPGHNGETRAERINEFCVLNPTVPVIGIREGSALLRTDQTLQLIGDLDGVVFLDGKERSISAGQDLSEYL